MAIEFKTLWLMHYNRDENPHKIIKASYKCTECDGVISIADPLHTIDVNTLGIVDYCGGVYGYDQEEVERALIANEKEFVFRTLYCVGFNEEDQLYVNMFRTIPCACNKDTIYIINNTGRVIDKVMADYLFKRPSMYLNTKRVFDWELLGAYKRLGANIKDWKLAISRKLDRLDTMMVKISTEMLKTNTDSMKFDLSITMPHSCPECGSKMVNGVCKQCYFRMDDLSAWDEDNDIVYSCNSLQDY